MKKLALALLVILLLGCFCACTADKGTLRLEVTDITEEYGGQEITITTHNTTGLRAKFEWNNFLITTTEGTFERQASWGNEIPMGTATNKYRLKDCPGTVTKIVAITIEQLDEKGFSNDLEWHDVVLFDSEAGITHYEDRFTFLDREDWQQELFLRLFLAIFIPIAIGIYLHRYTKGINWGAFIEKAKKLAILKKVTAIAMKRKAEKKQGNILEYMASKHPHSGAPEDGQDTEPPSPPSNT